jgi:hypothetical protein
MAMTGTFRRFQWRRIRPAAWRRGLVAEAAAGEARLITASGELALRRAADLTHRSDEGSAGDPVDLYPAQQPIDLRREAICYAASSVITAIVLAIILFFVVPGALRG